MFDALRTHSVVLSFCLFELITILSYAYTIAFGGFCLASFLLFLHAFQLPPPPASRVNQFLEKCRSGVIAHRAGCPENTLAGIRRAKERGLKVVEMDLEYTKDGYPVLLHDPSVDRTSNGTGNIREMKFDEVRKLDFGGKYDSEYTGEQIPTLTEALDLCEELDMLLLLDVKSNRRKTASVLKQLFSERNLYDRVMVVSFYPELLYMVRSADPGILVGLARNWWQFTWNLDGTRRHDRWWRQLPAPFYDLLLNFSNATFVWWFVGISFILFRKHELSRNVVELWERRGIHLMAWTVDGKEEAIYFSENIGVSILMDKPCTLN